MSKQNNCDLIFVAQSAVFYFYNRIVEYDGTFTLSQANRTWLDGNYNDGSDWVKFAVAKDPNQSLVSRLSSTMPSASFCGTINTIKKTR